MSLVSECSLWLVSGLAWIYPQVKGQENELLAVYRCQEAVNRIEIKVRILFQFIPIQSNMNPNSNRFQSNPIQTADQDSGGADGQGAGLCDSSSAAQDVSGGSVPDQAPLAAPEGQPSRCRPQPVLHIALFIAFSTRGRE